MGKILEFFKIDTYVQLEGQQIINPKKKLSCSISVVLVFQNILQSGFMLICSHPTRMIIAKEKHTTYTKTRQG